MEAVAVLIGIGLLILAIWYFRKDNSVEIEKQIDAIEKQETTLKEKRAILKAARAKCKARGRKATKAAARANMDAREIAGKYNKRGAVILIALSLAIGSTIAADDCSESVDLTGIISVLEATDSEVAFDAAALMLAQREEIAALCQRIESLLSQRLNLMDDIKAADTLLALSNQRVDIYRAITRPPIFGAALGVGLCQSDSSVDGCVAIIYGIRF